MEAGYRTVTCDEGKRPDGGTLVEPRLMLEVEAAEAAAGRSELSARYRTLHNSVTEDMMVCRMDRIPARASDSCF